LELSSFQIGNHTNDNPIALAVLVKYFNKNFYDAWELVKEKVPICNIDPSHIALVKKMFKVKPQYLLMLNSTTDLCINIFQFVADPMILKIDL
jgi:hypothetical protein